MDKVIRIVAALPGIMFVVMGLRWVVDPAGAAAAVGMPLLDGVARSNQIGDLGSFFVGAGIMILLGVVTLQRIWLYCASLLIGVVAIFRVLAWAVQDAALTTQFIGVEIVITALLLFAASRLSRTADRAADDVPGGATDGTPDGTPDRESADST